MEHLLHQTEDDVEFLKAFSESSLETLSSLRGLRMYTGSREDLARDYLDEVYISLNSTLDEYFVEVYEPRQIQERKKTIALDASSIRLAESSKGVVISVKGAIVTRDVDNSLSIKILGPFIFHINKTNIRKIIKEYSGILQYSSKYEFYINAQKGLTELLEKKMQEYVVKKARDSIVLFDGCLAANNFTHYKSLMEKILKVSIENRNMVIAFSKTSFLQISGAYLQTIYVERESPYIIDLTNALRRYYDHQVKILGRVCLARLGIGSPGYRVDIPNEHDIPTLFGVLLKSDPLIYGYPETLILAHDYSTFTKLDMISLQTMLRKMDVELLYPEYVRDILFQPIDGENR
ncbi:MAG: hypothetical protein QXF28_05315 [Nitrososphaerota archaeon]